MSFRSRMDAAYGRRGGRFSEFPQRPRPELGPNKLLGIDVVVLEHLSQRRSRVAFGREANAATAIAPDHMIGPNS